MIRYNPFNKNIEELESKDLEVLREISEGWYVEYKSAMQSLKKIAKSIGSFANTYGGWLFYGISESNDGEHKAGSFPGITLSEVPDALLKIREAVSSHISPTTYYEHIVIKGPYCNLGLDCGKAIIVICVPYSSRPPYVHSSGKIYRRVGDSSDPIPESDRGKLDILWERSRESRNKLRSFLEKDFYYSKGEEESPFIHFFLMADLFNDRSYSSKITYDIFTEIMSDSKLGGLSFDNIYTTPNGCIARMVFTNDPYRMVLTWRYYRNCNSVITLPLSYCKINYINNSDSFWKINKYLNTEDFVSKCFKAKLEDSLAVDLTALLPAILYIYLKHRILLSRDNNYGPFFLKIRCDNFWRKIPYIDTKDYLSFIEKHGIPLVQEESFFIPEEDILNFIPLKEINKNFEEKEAYKYLGDDFVSSFMRICSALGLPDITYSNKEDLQNLIESLRSGDTILK